MKDKKVTFLNEIRNKTKEIACVTDDEAQSILNGWFLLNFEIKNENGLYTASINDYTGGVVTIETISGEIWQSIYAGRYFSQLSDIVCTYLAILIEQREFIENQFIYVSDSLDPNENEDCTVVTSDQLIHYNIKVVIKRYGDASELKFYFKDGHELFDVQKWHQDAVNLEND